MVMYQIDYKTDAGIASVQPITNQLMANPTHSYSGASFTNPPNTATPRKIHLFPTGSDVGGRFIFEILPCF